MVIAVKKAKKKQRSNILVVLKIYNLKCINFSPRFFDL